MHTGVWIILGAFLAFAVWQAGRGVRAGKRERKRLEALFKRVAECRCALCGTPHGKAVQSEIHISFTDDDELPAHLAGAQGVNTWRITCPHCRGIVLLAENEDHFELLKLKKPNAEEKKLSPAYLTVVVLLSVTVIGVAVYSMVRFFMR